MTDFTQMLNEIEEAPRGNARIDALQNILKGEPTGTLQRVFTDTLSPFITFGVQKLPQPYDQGHRYRDDAHWAEEMFIIGTRLANRTLTGHAAQEAIGVALGACDNQWQTKWMTRYFLRDLRLDLGSKSVQKLVGEEALPLFDVPLATDYAKMKKIEGRWVMEPKYDGARVVAFINSPEEVVLKSRTGKVWGNFKAIEEAVLEFAKEANLPLPYVLDGEVVALDDNGEINFQAVQKVLMSQKGTGDVRLHYIVFDGCRFAEWMKPQQTYLTRYSLLKSTFKEMGQDVGEISLTEGDVVELQTDTAVAELTKYSQTYVGQRYEGAIARRADAVVKNKRTKDLLKVKAFKDAEATIVGVIEGTGKYVGMLGALKCKLADGKEFDIGSGFSDRQRQELWELAANGTKLYEALAVFKYFELTNDGIPRFPIFKSLRSRDDVSAPADETDDE